MSNRPEPHLTSKPRLLAAALALGLASPACMISPEHGDWIESILHPVTFNVVSPWEDANYSIETAIFNSNDEVIGWNFLVAGQTDTFLLTDPDGRDLFIDTKTTSILVGWTAAPGPGCGGINPECHKKVRIRGHIQGPTGATSTMFTYDDGTASCRSNALVSGGADEVITECARDEDWIEVFAYDD